jgi:hypothetical protein
MTRGCPPAWEMGVGVQPFTVKNKFVMDNSDEPRQRNIDMIFGLWNVRSLYRAGSLMIVS